ncbi:hypothetical protein P9112_006892 [Eukaryota sp. TZLM1-RC]
MHLAITPEVQNALDNGIPVVALESTIITHGMPYPKNIECALEVEQVVRDNGSIPATIAIVDGKIHIGLDRPTLESLGKGGPKVTKASRRDLPFVIMKSLSAGTTVATTMLLAQAAGIKVFATGGIGGVSRGYDTVLDVSADLPEFAKSKVMVVSAGCKSIMDIPNTLEYLETEGIPVVGFQTSDFPSFYSRSSGLKVPLVVDSAEEAARLYHVTQQTTPCGILLANPIPQENEIPNEEIGPIIDEALKECKEQGFGGKDLTPFMLKRIVEKTGGKSLTCNIALVKNNAKVASLISVELAKLSQ